MDEIEIISVRSDQQQHVHIGVQADKNVMERQDVKIKTMLHVVEQHHIHVEKVQVMYWKVINWMIGALRSGGGNVHQQMD